MADTKLSIYYQNVRRLRIKYSDLFNGIPCKNYDILLFTETWLQDDISCSEFCDDSYDVFRCDRNLLAKGKKTGGGALMCIKREFSATVCPCVTCERSDLLCVTLPACAI